MVAGSLTQNLVCQLLENPFQGCKLQNLPTRSRDMNLDITAAVAGTHRVTKYSGSRTQNRCYYCYHGYSDVRKVKTYYYCSYCGDKYPICPPTNKVRQCWDLHLKFSMPIKKGGSAIKKRNLRTPLCNNIQLYSHLNRSHWWKVPMIEKSFIIYYSIFWISFIIHIIYYCCFWWILLDDA